MNKGDVVSILKLAQDQKLPENLNSNSGLNLECVKDFIERGYIQARISQVESAHSSRYSIIFTSQRKA